MMRTGHDFDDAVGFMHCLAIQAPEACSAIVLRGLTVPLATPRQAARACQDFCVRGIA
jgi:hypothetical protein